MLSHKNTTLTVGQRRTLQIALTSAWAMRDGEAKTDPVNFDHLCNLTIKLAGVDEAELDAMPIAEQPWALYGLAQQLAAGLTGEASGA